MIRSSLLFLLCMSSAATGVRAQEPSGVGEAKRAPAVLVSINPLGFLQFGPNLEVEIPAGPGGVALGARVASLGLLSHAVADADDDVLESSWTVTAAWRFYPKRSASAGWFFGPRVEYGTSRTRDYDGTLVIGGGEGGYRWLLDNVGVTLGLQSGAIANRFRNRADGSDSGTEVYGIAMLVFGIGISVR